jgi:hypothetical protein
MERNRTFQGGVVRSVNIIWIVVALCLGAALLYFVWREIAIAKAIAADGLILQAGQRMRRLWLIIIGLLSAASLLLANWSYAQSRIVTQKRREYAWLSTAGVILAVMAVAYGYSMMSSLG